MAKYKTEFELNAVLFKDRMSAANIIGEDAKGDKVYVSFSGPDGNNIGYIKDKDLERFAVNILRSLNSKRLKK